MESILSLRLQYPLPRFIIYRILDKIPIRSDRDHRLDPLLCQLRGKKIQPLRNQMHRIGPQDQQLRIRRPQMKPRLRHHRQRPIPVIGIIVPFNICIIEGEIIHSA